MCVCVCVCVCACVSEGSVTTKSPLIRRAAFLSTASQAISACCYNKLIATRN